MLLQRLPKPIPGCGTTYHFGLSEYRMAHRTKSVGPRARPMNLELQEFELHDQHQIRKRGSSAYYAQAREENK